MHKIKKVQLDFLKEKKKKKPTKEIKGHKHRTPGCCKVSASLKSAFKCTRVGILNKITATLLLPHMATYRDLLYIGDDI